MKTLKTFIIAITMLISFNAEAQVTYHLVKVDVKSEFTEERKIAYSNLITEIDSFRYYFFVKVKLTTKGLTKKIVFGKTRSVKYSFNNYYVYRFKPVDNSTLWHGIEEEELSCIKKEDGVKKDYTFKFTVYPKSYDMIITTFSYELNSYVDFYYEL